MMIDKKYSCQPNPLSQHSSVLVRTPSTYPNGDRIYLVASQQLDGSTRLSDGGCTVDSLWQMGLNVGFRACRAEMKWAGVKTQLVDDGSIELWTTTSLTDCTTAAMALTDVCRAVMEANVSKSALARARSLRSKLSLTGSLKSADSPSQRPKFGFMNLQRGRRKDSGASIVRGQQSS